MNKLTHKDFLEKLQQKRKDFNDFKIRSTYQNTKTKIKVKHICGYEYEVTPNHLLNGRKCPACGGGGIRNKTTDVFKIEVKELTNDYTVLGEYVGVKEKIKIKHDTCGYTFEMRPGDFLAGQRCPKCGKMRASKMKTKDHNVFKEEIEKLGNGEYVILTDYTNNKEHVTLRHSCGHEYNVSPVNFLKGHGCPKCSLISSSGETELLEFIKTLYTGEIIENDRTLLNGKEIDIYIPNENIAFEYDGLYWHSESQGKTKKYHLSKTENLNNQNIRLIHVFEDEWIYKKELTKNKIRHILNKNVSTKVYAKKCNVQEIDTQLKNEFLDKNHIQGKDKSSIKYGLYHNSELVAVMTFSKLRVALGNKKSDKSYELVRYATNSDYIVVGGFGKLLKHFQRNTDYKTIKTYADLRWSDPKSNIYEKNNFVGINKSEPNYWYFNSSKLIRYHRYGFRKDSIKKRFPEVYDVTRTEKEMMKDLGYYKIWDCGNLVYELKNDKKD